MKSRTLCLVAAVALAATGCSVGPNYQEPNVAVPDKFDTGVAATTATAPSTQPAQPPVDLARWWHSLQDAELDSLVDRAVAANLDLQIALARLQEARAYEYAVAGGVLPFIEAGGAMAHGSGNNSVKGRIAPPLNAGTNSTGLKEITEVVGFDAGWEIDLFGRFRRQLEAAAADTQVAVEFRNDVLLTLVSDVVRAYMKLRTLQLRLDIAQQNISLYRQTLDLVQQRFDRGLTNELDVALARRQLSSTLATVAPLQDSIGQAQRRIAVLLGLSPQSLYDELQKGTRLPDLPEQVAASLPVDILRRRPDIRRAERQVAGDSARIGVATADLFPRVAITAGLGMQGQGLGRNPVSNSFIGSIGPTAIWPLLDFGRVDSLIQVADFRNQESLLNYRRIILQAVQEVDNAMGGYAAENDRFQQLGAAVDASQRAVTLATGRYERGLIDFLNVLDAQRQYYTLQDQYTVAHEAVVLQFVALYKSLGGGWELYQNVPPIRKPLPALLAAGAEVAGRSHRVETDQAESQAQK